MTVPSLSPDEIVKTLQKEIQTGDINAYYQKELGISAEMAAILTSATLARAITFGYALPSVIESFLDAWRKESHGSPTL